MITCLAKRKAERQSDPTKLGVGAIWGQPPNVVAAILDLFKIQKQLWMLSGTLRGSSGNQGNDIWVHEHLSTKNDSASIVAHLVSNELIKNIGAVVRQAPRHKS